MKLNKLVIDNFRCFKHYEIEFAPSITVLIGKNGTGKSSLIHAIHYALSFIFTNDSSMGNDFLSAGNPDLKVISSSPFDFYKDHEKGETAIDLSIQGEAIFNKRELSWNMYKRSTSGASLLPSKYEDAYRSFMEEYRKSNQLPLLAYYSDSFPHREGKLTDFAKETIKEQGTIIRNFGYYQWDEETVCTSIWEKRFINALNKHNTLGDKDPLTSAEVNFIKNKLRAFSKPTNEQNDSDFRIDELHVVFDDDTKPTLYVRLANGKDVAFINLPAGYRRLYSIVFDIAYRAYILNLGKVENPQGIVIIDEIDLHLHPSLEQEVLQRLQNTFPSLQFIVSTHSPLVISNLNPENGNNVVLRMEIDSEEPEKLPDIYGIDYNASISDFMGTPHTNLQISEIRDSILRLLRQEKTNLADKRKQELQSVIGSESRYNEVIKDIETSL
ncbi:MAG: AAA family ATPase [Candidatus Symbiothrix sp.]|jgi:predicted ATP-binding protein involved in virulence|nr:AAA family ATPase [Candidatus Symbiothrix sp.]